MKVDKKQLARALNDNFEGIPRAVVLSYSICDNIFCIKCVFEVMELFKGQGIESAVVCNELEGFECERCYFSKKPCTTPSCPHEVGVPTKLCVNCRRARYCSKE